MIWRCEECGWCGSYAEMGGGGRCPRCGECGTRLLGPTPEGCTSCRLFRITIGLLTVALVFFASACLVLIWRGGR